MPSGISGLQLTGLSIRVYTADMKESWLLRDLLLSYTLSLSHDP